MGMVFDYESNLKKNIYNPGKMLLWAIDSVESS